MSCWNIVRKFGILLCLVSTLIFFVGSLNHYWVQSDTGHYGLWRKCDIRAIIDTTSTTTARPHFGSSSHDKDDDDSSDEVDDDDNDDGDDDDDDGDCSSFELGSLPGYFHFVRAIMIIASVILALGILSGRTIRFTLQTRPSFVETHIAELLGSVACAIMLIGLKVFKDNFKTFENNTFRHSRLDWSYKLVQASCYMYLCAAFFLMLESYRLMIKKGSWHGICPTWSDCKTLNRLCDRMGLKKPARSESETRDDNSRYVAVPIPVGNTDNNNDNQNAPPSYNEIITRQHLRIDHPTKPSAPPSYDA